MMPSIPSQVFPLRLKFSSFATCSSRRTWFSVSFRCCSNPARSSGSVADLAIFGRALVSWVSALYVSFSSSSSRSRRLDWDGMRGSSGCGRAREEIANLESWAGPRDAKIPDGEQRPEVVPGQRLASPLQPVHHADDALDLGTDLLDFGDRLEDTAAGGQHVVDDRHPVAGLHLALDALLAPVPLGLLADEEALHRSSVLVVAHGRRGRHRDGTDFRPADRLDRQVARRMVKQLADQGDGLAVEQHLFRVDVVAARLARR